MKTLYVSIVILFLSWYNTAISAETKLKAAGCKTEAILIDELCRNYSGAKIKPARTGNKKALILFAKGKIDFAFTCKPVSKLIKKFKINPAKTKDWKCIAFARDPIVVVINPDTGISDLSLSTLSKIFTGNITNWKELGGNDIPVEIGYMDSKKVETGNNTVFKECTLQKYVTPAGKISNTPNQNPNLKADFTKKAIILDSPAKLGNFVAVTPGGIAFMGLNSYKSKYGIALKVDGIEPTLATVRSGEYPMAVTYHLIYSTSGPEAVKQFITYALSPEGQTITARNFVSIEAKEIQ